VESDTGNHGAVEMKITVPCISSRYRANFHRTVILFEVNIVYSSLELLYMVRP